MSEKVFCKECLCVKQKSKVYVKAKAIVGGRSVFYDETGSKHAHDNTFYIITYTCSRGHVWEENSYGKCFNEKCDWNGESVTIKN